MLEPNYNAGATYDAAAAAAEAMQSGRVPGQNSLGKEEFLKLLVAQLSHQDPLNPLAGHEFAAHLAQFTSVEQLINLNEGVAGQADLHNLLAQSINSGVAAGLIGKSIEANANTFTVGDQSTTLNGGIDLSATAASVTIEIMDANGDVVDTIELGAQREGRHEFTWDGKNASGATVPAGDYYFKTTAVDGNGDSIDTAPIMRGVVDRVTFTQEGIKLWVNGSPIAMGAVTSVE